MTEFQSQSTEETLESILKKIGPIKVNGFRDWDGPYNGNDENEVWARQKAIQLRHVYERYPDHEAALSCLDQHAELELEQPILFAEIHDDLNAKEFKLTGLYRQWNFDSEDHLQEWRRDSEPIYERHDKRAAEILSKYPDLGIAEWAYHHSLNRYRFRLLRDLPRYIREIELLVEDLIQTVEQYLSYGQKRPPSIEPSNSYYRFGRVLSVESLILAVDALEPNGRSAQSTLLRRISSMFPGHVSIANYTFKFNSLNEPFELKFKDLVSGENVDIRDYRGKIVIVDFWATWCRPCLTFVPYIKKVLSSHANDVKVIGISNDDRRIGAQATLEQRRKVKSIVVECAARHGIDWPILLDHRLHDRLHIKRIPTIFVIDKHGILRSLNARATLAKTVDKLLQE